MTTINLSTIYNISTTTHDETTARAKVLHQTATLALSNEVVITELQKEVAELKTVLMFITNSIRNTPNETEHEEEVESEHEEEVESEHEEKEEPLSVPGNDAEDDNESGDEEESEECLPTPVPSPKKKKAKKTKKGSKKTKKRKSSFEDIANSIFEEDLALKKQTAQQNEQCHLDTENKQERK